MAKLRKRAVKLFYCGSKFYVKNLRKAWIGITDSVARQYLIRGGWSGKYLDSGLSPADNHLLTIRERDGVAWAGPIAGMKCGPLVANGDVVLVTKSPNLPSPVKGTFEQTEEILGAQFGEELPIFLEWNKQAYLRISNQGGAFLPGLVLGGASGTGKSMLGNVITKNLLGGRVGKPFRYMAGETTFNSDLCGAELLLLDDVPDRMKFEKLELVRAELKRMLADPTDSLHRKGADAITVPVVRALLVCVNEEPHNLKFLPLDDSSMDDKLILLRVKERPKCLPYDYEGQIKLEQTLRAELPHFLHFLLNVFKMPKAMQWRRGQPCFRDQSLTMIAHEEDSVSRVMWLIGELDGLPADALSAPKLEKFLIEAKGHEEVQRLIGRRSLGHVLREASKRYPRQVISEGTEHGGMTKWRIERGVS